MSKDIKTKATIEVGCKRYGVHRWPDAPKHVQYLKYEHCHTFCFFLVIEVEHLDRALEFDTVQAFLYGAIDYLRLIQTGSTYSCEQMADLLFDLCIQTYPTLQAVKVGEHDLAMAVVQRVES